MELVPRILFGLMHAGAIVLPFFVPMTWTAFGLFLGFYMLRGFGLTAGFHRYFAHRAYQTGRVFQFCLAWFGTMAVQRGPMWWAGHHRHHHKYSDLEGDPHSPIVDSIWWSHLGWIVSDDLKDADREVMKDWHKYPELWWLDKYDWIPGVAMAVVCAAVGGLSGFVWGFLFGTVLLYHSTFMVNSMCHLLGTRRYHTPDRSRNNFFVAFMTMGEG
ncbi:MAG: acyl-CoA desaturase, partial [Fimbriiglobus sp.]